MGVPGPDRAVIPEHGKTAILPGSSGSVIPDGPSLNGKTAVLPGSSGLPASHLTEKPLFCPPDRDLPLEGTDRDFRVV